jgi:hypothetical protein
MADELPSVKRVPPVSTASKTPPVWTDKMPFGKFLRAKADALRIPPAVLLAVIGVVGLAVGATGFCCLPVGVILLATSGSHDRQTNHDRSKNDGDLLTEDFFPRKSGAKWSYQHVSMFEGTDVRVHIDYSFASSSKIETYAWRVEIILPNGKTVPALPKVEQVLKNMHTGTTTVKRDGSLLLVKHEDRWDPYIKVGAHTGESWDGVKVGNLQTRYHYKGAGEHRGIKTAIIVEELLIDGKVENVIERTFGFNIGLLSAESHHDENGIRVVTHKTIIDGFDHIDDYVNGKMVNLIEKERAFFK